MHPEKGNREQLRKEVGKGEIEAFEVKRKTYDMKIQTQVSSFNIVTGYCMATLQFLNTMTPLYI